MTILTMVTSVRVLSVVSAQEQSAPAGEMFATRPRIDIPPVSLPLEEARVGIRRSRRFRESGKRPGGHRGGRLQRQPDSDGLHGWQLEILGALRRRQGGGRGGTVPKSTPPCSAEQVKTNPARFQSALSMLEGEILLIPGGTPLIINNVVVGGIGSAGHRGDGDVRAVKAGIAAWEKFRQSRR